MRLIRCGPGRPGRVVLRFTGLICRMGLVLCWAVLRAPAGKLLAPSLPDLVPMLRAEKALDITDGAGECCWPA
jgi:hypothetical protein